VTAPEVEFLLDEVLQPVVDGQPDDHPLRRVDRNQSEVYGTGESIDMQTPMPTRTEQLRQANFVGIASEGADPSPAGPNERYELQSSLSVRVEGMAADKKGHIDSAAADAVPFDDLFWEVLIAIQNAMSYPDVGRSVVSYCDLTTANIDDSQSEWADFHRGEFDVVFRGYTKNYD